MHPLGKSPVITDGNQVVAESGAILEYLEEKYDHEFRLKVSDEASRLQCRYWLHYAEGSLMPLLVMKLIFGQMGKAPVPWLLRPVGAAFGKGVQKAFLDKQLKPHMQMIEQHLAANPWFAGQRFSIADIQMSFPPWRLRDVPDWSRCPPARNGCRLCNSVPPGSARSIRAASFRCQVNSPLPLAGRVSSRLRRCASP